MIDWVKRMTPEQRAEYEQSKAWHEENVREARAMDDDMLATKCEYFLTQCERVLKWVPGTPVYDAAIFHVIVPEMIRRLKKRGDQPKPTVVWPEPEEK